MTKLGLISISKIVTICVYSSISANGSQLALNVENLVPNFWTYMNGTVSMLLAPLAHRWHHWQVVGTFLFFLML